MRYFFQIYRQNKWFLLPYLIVFILTLALALIYGRLQTHIFVNQLHSPVADQFFKYLTYLGSGYFLVLVMIVVAIIHRRLVGALLFSALIFNVLLHGLKRTINAYRPVKYFEIFAPDYNLHLVKGVDIHYLHSFPSGHAATAFAVFFFLAFLTKRNWLKIVYLVLAILVAYSRVYLSQHFVIDVVIGSLIGILGTYLGLIWYLATNKIAGNYSNS